MLIQQNENADTVLVFKWINPDGFCSSLLRMLYFFALCQRKGYYFILDNQSFSVIPYTDVFKPFWSEETNRSMLESAKQIHVFGNYPIKDDGRVLRYKPKDLNYLWIGASLKKPWESRPHRDVIARRTYKRLVKLGAKYGLFTKEDLARSWDAHMPAGLLSKIYQLQDNIQEQVDDLKRTANLPDKYQAIQVRRKQEYIKAIYNAFFKRPPPLTEYLSKLDPDIQDVYVATDTEDVVQRLRREKPGAYKYHSFIHKNKTPHIVFDAKSHQERVQNAAYLLADIEICAHARVFIGGDHSAVSNAALYLRRDLGKEINHPVKWKREAWYVIFFTRLKIKLHQLYKFIASRFR